MNGTAQCVGSIRLGQAIGFAARQHLSGHLPPGVRVVPVLGLSPSELRVAWPASATSCDVARFVRHATEATPAQHAAG